VGLKLNGAHHLLAYDDDVNLLGNNIGTIKKNTETLFNAEKLALNVAKRRSLGRYSSLAD
jgi:hypothetical protein